jgi:fibronectin-binding autotransporter adhesin
MNDFDNQGITNARNTIIYGSTVVFDNSVFNTDGVTNSRTITNVSGSYLQSYSGTFRLLGNTSANTTQSVGNNGAQFNYAANTIQVLSGTGAGQTTVLNMGNLTRSNAGTANFIVTSQGSGNATVTTTLANGTGNILGSWLTYNGTSYAANDGSNNIIAFAGYNTANFTSTTVSDINAGFTTSGAATSVGMRFNDSSATTLTLSGTLAGASNSLGVLVTDNVNAPITITGSNITATDLVVHQYETSGALTIASQLSGASVRVVATGPGTVVVGNGANNGNAAATIGQGVLEVSAANALGSSTASTNINISGNGTLRYTGSADYQRGGGTGGTGQVNLLGNGNIENNGTGKLTLGSTQGFAIISSYSPNLTIGGSGSIDVAGIQLGTAFIYEGYSKLTKTGSGTVTLTEESILQGGLDINAGTFALSGNGSIQAWTPVNINGGTFDNKTALTKQGGNIDLTSGNITSTGGGAFTIQALNAAIASGNSTVSANIQGELAAVSKTGAGTLTLNGSNTYGQGTYVSVGTLLVNNTSGSATGAGAVSVSSGATLGGNGTISGPVSAGGTLAAGNGIGTLTLGSLTLTSSGILDNELGRNGAAPVSDLVAINGSVSLASGSDLKLTLYGGLSAPQAGDVFFLIGNDGADSITGVFTKLNGAATTLNEGSQFSWNSQSWAITYTADMGTSSFTGGNDLALMVVPEPSTWILIVLGGIFCLLWRAGAASDRKRLSGVTGATSQ